MSSMDEFREKYLSLKDCGGQDKIKKQHDAGKKTARERLELLFDQGTFVELDAFVTHRCNEFDMSQNVIPGDGVITGYGAVDSRLVFAYFQDFTVMGGSLGEMHAHKICKIMDMASKMGAPIIAVNDSGGARIQEGIAALAGFGDIFYRNSLMSGVVPQIAVILGPCAGGAVYSPAICDFVFMVEDISQMFITGPQVVKSVTGEDVSLEELGGAKVHSQKSGVVHFKVTDEVECFKKVKKLISFLPQNNLEHTFDERPAQYLDQMCGALSEILPSEPNRGYDITRIILEVVDGNDFFEISADFAKNIVIGFGRINGQSVGIVANQPNFMAGALDVDSSDKAARFIRFCDAFNIAIVTFTDVPGYLPGVQQEYNGIIRHGAKLLYALSEATVTKINVIIRKAYGGAYIAMNSKHLGADLVFAWPSAEIAVMGPQGAANIVFRKEISSAEDPVAMRDEKINEYTAKFANPYLAASMGYVDAIIDPAETRWRIISALDMLRSKRKTRPKKKHGNIPL